MHGGIDLGADRRARRRRRAAKSNGSSRATIARSCRPTAPAASRWRCGSSGRTLFFNYGWADRADKRPITTARCSIWRRCARCSRRRCWRRRSARRTRLEDPVAKYVAELQQGGDIRQVTLGQLATHTSGLLLPQDHPPWPDWGYTLPEFIRTLNAWKADKEPGKQHLYTHAGYHPACSLRSSVATACRSTS